MTLKLGKLPARPEAHKLKLAAYAKKAALPTPPDAFGWDYLISSWPMLLNGGDPITINGIQVGPLGDCAIAGSLHETQLLCASAHKTVNVNDYCAVENYSIIAGYKLGDDTTDQGTDVVDLMTYRQQYGMLDADGNHHKIVAGVSLVPGDLDMLARAVWLFGCAGLGFTLPQSAEDQFGDGQPWTVVKGSPIVGGHYVSLVGRGDGYWRGVSWGAEVKIADAFIKKNCDEAWLPLSQEMIDNGKNLDGIDWAALTTDAQCIAQEEGVAGKHSTEGEEPYPYPNPFHEYGKR